MNTSQIKNYLSKLDKLDSDRVLCGLDLLIENIQNNLFDILHEGKLMVEIDSSTKEVTILGDEMNVKNRKIVFDKEKNKESIYNTFTFAIDYARQVEGGEDLIKEIQPK